MQISVDLSRLDRYISVVEEELREIERLDGILARQIRQSGSLPTEWEKIRMRRRYLDRQRESARGRQSYLKHVQEKMAVVARCSEEELNELRQYLQHTT